MRRFAVDEVRLPGSTSEAQAMGGDLDGDKFRAPADCQSGACTAGACAAPSCTDGRRDGFESDVDCGSNCGPCAKGERCVISGDCETPYCAGGFCDIAPP